GRGIDHACSQRVEIHRRKLLQERNYNEEMIVLRFATLVALVFWLGAMTAARFDDVFRRTDVVGYTCGAAVVVGLLAMKFLGPPPAGFIPRAAIAILMLALAVVSGLNRAMDAAATLLTVNIALGLLLLTWYVRE